MSSSVTAELYVLRPQEGGRLATLYSGCNATLKLEGLETGVCVQLNQCEALRGGETGIASLTLLHHETPLSALHVGETVSLNVDGEHAAIGQILGDNFLEEAEEVVPNQVEAGDDPPRLVVLVSILMGGLFCLLFARNVGAIWQKLIGLVVSIAAVVIWNVYSELRTATNTQNCDEPADARESPS